jgi:type III pantothenate kinase
MIEGVVLLVDVGNSFLKVAQAHLQDVGPVRRLSVSSGEAALVDELSGLMAGRADGATGAAMIAAVSVVPRWTDALPRIVAHLGATLLVADATSIPLPTSLAPGARTGPDRLMAAWAARELRGAPVIVADVGTATTVDGVDAAGTYRGGAILAGPELAARSLAGGTAALPAIEPVLPERALGRDTRTALESGLVIGHLGAIRELAARIRLELAAPEAPLIVTGGVSGAGWARRAFLEPAGPGLPPVASALDPHLVLRGLAMLAASRAVAVP